MYDNATFLELGLGLSVPAVGKRCAVREDDQLTVRVSKGRFPANGRPVQRVAVGYADLSVFTKPP